MPLQGVSHDYIHLVYSRWCPYIYIRSIMWLYSFGFSRWCPCRECYVTLFIWYWSGDALMGSVAWGSQTRQYLRYNSAKAMYTISSIKHPLNIYFLRMVEGLLWAIWLHLLQSTKQLTTLTAYWIDCLPGSCSVYTPQLGLSSELGYEFMSQSALAALIVIADMTCPMDVEFHYVSSQRITGILGSVRHPRMAALRPL